ncbi:MAG TPA: hypothetical protein VG345_12410 [Bryobacteraceae bacterium]|nr:hypothetical protein [Bryobacteraceae bacterium]
MKRKISVIIKLAILFAGLLLAAAVTLFAQDIEAWIRNAGGKPALAVVDLRGAGQASGFMSAFNSTLWNDLQNSGLFELRAKSMYPLNNPQRPEDIRPEDNRQGYALQDWAGAPVNASHLAFGYAAAQNGVFVLYGYLDDARQTNPQSAQLLGQRYAEDLSEQGAIKAAHAFANDIIQKFGGNGSLLGSRIYFISNRSGANEVWAMDWDGNNQKQLTHLRAKAPGSLYPTVSPDGTRVAFTTYAYGTPRVMMVDTLSSRILPFYNQEASLNATPSFTPDGKQVYYASTAAGLAQIYVASINGQGFRRISYRDAIEMEPKVNPKNPNILLFVSGPNNPQIYQMTSTGADIQRVTNGEGEAGNPAWNPDGQHVAFSWTRGYATGNFNVFVMDIASRQYVQLTSGAGRNENPVWAPDGRHLVFMSNRTGREQILTMLADGTQVKQLTTQGTNRYPVWGVQ